MKYLFCRLIICFTVFSTFTYASNSKSNPLPSWQDGPTKQSIINFVKAVTNPKSKDYVLPEKRIAVFDNDGTLWVEQPLYPQNMFMMDRIEKLANKHPEWQEKAPFKNMLKRDISAQSSFTPNDYILAISASSSDMTTDEYRHFVTDWLAKAKDNRFHKHYTELVYQPMQEILAYLKQNGFTNYIVTGGGQGFVRCISEKLYHIPIDKVIGTSLKTNYVNTNNVPVLINDRHSLFVTDRTGKPEAIHLFIGQKPLIAFGNSDGDREMLEWTTSGKGPRLGLLVHHDDAKREYAYDAQSKIGTFSINLMQHAKSHGWKVISMKNDWKKIFSFDQV